MFDLLYYQKYWYHLIKYSKQKLQNKNFDSNVSEDVVS